MLGAGDRHTGVRLMAPSPIPCPLVVPRATERPSPELLVLAMNGKDQADGRITGQLQGGIHLFLCPELPQHKLGNRQAARAWRMGGGWDPHSPSHPLWP